jgi:hypothetical protein
MSGERRLRWQRESRQKRRRAHLMGHSQGGNDAIEIARALEISHGEKRRARFLASGSLANRVLRAMAAIRRSLGNQTTCRKLGIGSRLAAVVIATGVLLWCDGPLPRRPGRSSCAAISGCSPMASTGSPRN